MKALVYLDFYHNNSGENTVFLCFSFAIKKNRNEGDLCLKDIFWLT